MKEVNTCGHVENFTIKLFKNKFSSEYLLVWIRQNHHSVSQNARPMFEHTVAKLIILKYQVVGNYKTTKMQYFE